VSYPTATQRDRNTKAETVTIDHQRVAKLSTAIQKARDRQRSSIAAGPTSASLEDDGVIQRQGDGFPLDQNRVAYLRFLRRERR
jgi:hypothetical protein